MNSMIVVMIAHLVFIVRPPSGPGIAGGDAQTDARIARTGIDDADAEKVREGGPATLLRPGGRDGMILAGSRVEMRSRPRHPAV